MFLKDNKMERMKWTEYVYILLRIQRQSYNKLFFVIRRIRGYQMLFKSLKD